MYVIFTSTYFKFLVLNFTKLWFNILPIHGSMFYEFMVYLTEIRASTGAGNIRRKFHHIMLATLEHCVLMTRWTKFLTACNWWFRKQSYYVCNRIYFLVSILYYQQIKATKNDELMYKYNFERKYVRTTSIMISNLYFSEASKLPITSENLLNKRKM